MSLPPNVTIPVTPFKIAIPDAAVEELKTLIKLSKFPPETYEGKHRKYGITRAWMEEARARWLNGYDWRQSEKKMNEYPQFIADVKDQEGQVHKIHFIGIFSDKPDATTLCLFHGWPGSFLEYLPLLESLKSSDIPLNLVVPSLTGFTFSSRPPVDRDWPLENTTFLMNGLMEGLGFGASNGGYISQGGDIGSFISRLLALDYPACRGCHLNMFFITEKPESCSVDTVDDIEKEGMQRGKQFLEDGSGYRIMHGTRPSTIGFTNASSPLALLAWLGEKFLDWTDSDPSVDFILEHVTLWWLTETFPTSIYPYRSFKPMDRYIQKPVGFSWFPQEIAPSPKTWMETLINMVYFKRHTKGGHFAAFEEPEGLSKDIISFVKIVQSGATSKI